MTTTDILYFVLVHVGMVFYFIYLVMQCIYLFLYIYLIFGQTSHNDFAQNTLTFRFLHLAMYWNTVAPKRVWYSVCMNC